MRFWAYQLPLNRNFQQEKCYAACHEHIITHKSAINRPQVGFGVLVPAWQGEDRWHSKAAPEQNLSWTEINIQTSACKGDVRGRRPCGPYPDTLLGGNLTALVQKSLRMERQMPRLAPARSFQPCHAWCLWNGMGSRWTQAGWKIKKHKKGLGYYTICRY